MSEITNLPDHVAIILDGNRRWARGKELQDEDGHRKGIETLVLIAKAAANFNIKYLTLFSFSKENWKRDPSEISNLMDLMESFESEYLDEIILNNIKVTVIGDIDTLAKPQKKIIKMVQERTYGNTGMQLIAAFNYSGRDEIIRAVKKIVNDAQLAKISTDMINNDLMGNYLDTANIPDPDLIIRTSGEMRLSNFLLWQCAYSEFIFTETFWPDFTVGHFYDALEQYSQRERRYGRNTPNERV